ncbi:hypothetical protein BUZ51_02210 [Staphylococcus hominis]|uniref:Phage protein n=1 Tax=Staphylococcus hominis TaxID=1290 RepID=A0A974L109_STAHO|nr:hypothetical protein [Staphylococcus hominis]PTK31903.1 hypothetical protein BUZ51_02210 [Staphylococcus hominis]
MYLIELSNDEEEQNEVLGYVDSKKIAKEISETVTNEGYELEYRKIEHFKSLEDFYKSHTYIKLMIMINVKNYKKETIEVRVTNVTKRVHKSELKSPLYMDFLGTKGELEFLIIGYTTDYINTNIELLLERAIPKIKHKSKKYISKHILQYLKQILDKNFIQEIE